MIGRNGQRAQVYSRDGRLVYERAPGGITTKHIYLAGRLVGSTTGATTTYLHTDTLGTVVRRTNAAGVELGPRQTWEPYGSLSNGQYLQAPGFTGHVSDVHSGLIYMQQRHYDPVAMRFMSVDPVHVDTGSGGNFNRYWYANNNPYSNVDPDGRHPFSITQMDGRQLEALRVQARAASIQSATQAAVGVRIQEIRATTASALDDAASLAAVAAVALAAEGKPQLAAVAGALAETAAVGAFLAEPSTERLVNAAGGALLRPIKALVSGNSEAQMVVGMSEAMSVSDGAVTAIEKRFNTEAEVR